MVLLGGHFSENNKKKPAQKQTALSRTPRNIPKAAVSHAANAVKDKVRQSAESAADFQEQPQENASPAVQASGQMLQTGKRMVKGTAHGAKKTVAAASRLVKHHKQAKGAQKLQDIAPLEDTVSHAGADAPASTQADIKMRPQPEAVSQVKLPTEQPPSPKVRFVEADAPHLRPAQSMPTEAAAPSAPIKQRAQPSVKNVVQTIKTKEAAIQGLGIEHIPCAETSAAAPNSLAPTQEAASFGVVAPCKQSRTADTAIPIKQQQAKQAVARKGQYSHQFSVRAPQKITKAKGATPDTIGNFTHHSSEKSASPALIQNTRIKTASPGKPAQRHAVKTRGKSVTKALHRTIKQEGRGIKTAAQAAAKTKQSAKAAQKTAQQAARVAKTAARKAAQAAKVVTKAVVSAIKGFLVAMKSLVAAIAAIGGTAFAIILMLSLIAIIAGSSLGIFLGAEPSGYGIPVTEVTSQLNEEYYQKISEIQAQVTHDKVEILASDGVMGIKWEDVLAVYSCKLAASDTPMEVVTFDEQKKEVLRGIMWDMNAVKHTTRVETKYVDVPVLDEDGNQAYNKDGEALIDKVPYTETTLIITVEHKTADEMAAAYRFTSKQYKALVLLQESDYASLWAKLLGGLVNGSGEIITPDTDWTGTDIFSWPLPQSFSITSRFGYRKDPFTGNLSFHSGTDISAPFGTPILAAAGGTVTVANATDPWGMSYGYHVKINHGGGQETLYAHASSICVTAGQNVQAGEVIGYVGSTGNSTGNHLHFEVIANGELTNALNYFKEMTQKVVRFDLRLRTESL